MWNLDLVCLEAALASVQYSCMLCIKRTIGSDIGLTHPIELLGDFGLVESCFGPFGDSASVGPR